MNFDGKKILAKPNGNTYDIIDALINITPQAIQQVKPSIKKLVPITGNAYIDAKSIAKFIQDNIKYKADGYDNQNIQLPGRLVNDTKLGDCKSFSLLFVSMMKSAGHKAGYRFASYRKNKIPTHVYNWVLDNDKNFYTFDTCVKTLKESPRHTYIKDMDVNYLTGSPENDYINGKAERQAKRAARKEKRQERRKEGKGFFQGAKKIALAVPRRAFRTMVALNIRSLATKLEKAIAKDENKVKELWTKFGGKFDKLQQSINAGKNKKPLFGKGRGVNGVDDFYYINEYDEYINGEPVTTATVTAAIAAAAPILVVVAKLFKDLKIKKEAGEETDIITPEEELEVEESGNKIKDPNFTASDDENKAGGSSTGFAPSPILIGGVIGAGLLIYLLTKKKK